MKRLVKTIYKRYREYLLPLGGIGVIVLLSLYVLIPQINSIIETNQMNKDKSTQLTKLIAKRELLDSIASGPTSNLLTDAEAALPQEKETASILISLENLTAQTQFTVDSVSFTPGLVSSESGTPNPQNTSPPRNAQTLLLSSTHGAPALVVSIKGRGETDQLIEFVKQLQNVRRIFDIQEIKVTYVPDTPNFLTADLILHVYYLPPIAEIGALDSELPRISASEQKILSSLAALPHVSKTLVVPNVPVEVAPVGKIDLFSP